MSTHNIGFYEDLTKIIFELSSNIIKYASYFFCFLLTLNNPPVHFVDVVAILHRSHSHVGYTFDHVVCNMGEHLSDCVYLENASFLSL